MKWSYVGPGYSSKVFPESVQQYKRLYSGNTGNLIYYFATQCVVGFTGSPMSVGISVDRINKRGSGLVLSLANQLGAHTDLSQRGLKLDGLEVPVVALGLGAQVKEMTDDFSFISDGTINWLRQFAERAKVGVPSITLRGDYTYSLMEKMGFGDYVVSIGCQTNFISSNATLGHDIYKRSLATNIERVSVAAGSPFNKELRRLEASLLHLAVTTNGDYVVQHPESFISLVARFSEEDLNSSIEKIYPAYARYGFTKESFLRAVRSNFRLYNDAVNWMMSHKNSDVVVGTRIHGVQSALQAGVPAICLYIDSRTKELCEKMRIPSASAHDFLHGIDLEDIRRILCDWDYEYYDSNRLELARSLKSFLDANSVPIGGSLSSLVS
ncbi:polysaccharide pyruvyl transferase family protein [Microbulbifer elongatus]|uniref:Polysaccharide pyruvyl transferase family protein n=1 Tax=Microbulbifer elongatus TaxID=86173 RepID=A0ABT1NX05_9GAMM|nr:polysaccharide pyruvyl transferase family protein [Microbulbifer elongatus]MCQ3828321.1 polysaccharide pyruvyl transferase family protein [Microbulbifer elongatus]